MDGWIERAADVDRVVAALTSGDSGLVLVVPEVEGAEGMGVSAVVAAALRRPEVAERFPEGIGRFSADGAHREEWVNELTPVLDHLHGEDVEPYSWAEELDFANLVHDEEAINGLLEERVFKPGPRLVAVDGLRYAREAMLPALAVPGCAWLVAADADDGELPFAITVRVGPMTSAQGVAMLRRDLPALDEGTAARLVELTGGWPLALALVHGLVVSQVVTGEPATDAALRLTGRLTGRLAGRLPGPVDLADPASRTALIGALVDQSVGWLRAVDPAAAERFLRLGLFGAGEAIPIGVAATMWSSGAAMTGGQIGALIARLEGLSLVSRRTDHPVLVFADAVGARVRELLGPEGLQRARQALADADPDETPEGWGDLPGSAEWMLRNLAGLYAGTGDVQRLEGLVCDPAWMAVRIQRSGVSAAMRDLSKAGTVVAEELHRVLASSAHLLETARDLSVSVAPTLAALLYPILHVGDDLSRWPAEGGRPWLECRWTPPHVPHPALLATHHSRSEGMTGLAMAPDGAWVAASASGGRVTRLRLDGTSMDSLLGHELWVTSVAVAPTGSWLATASWDETVRLWEQDGTPRAVLDDLPATAETVAIAPDGTWLVAGGDGFLRFWDADGTPRATAGEGDYRHLAIAPDGTWLAAVGAEVIELWNADGTRRALLSVGDDEDEGADAVAIAPSGEWLAILGEYGSLYLVNADGSPRAAFDDDLLHGYGLAIAPDGDWLAVGDIDENILIMGLDGSVRARLPGHTKAITGLAITPDGRRVVSASGDRTARIWDADLAVREPAEPRERHDLRGIAVAPDGSYVVTAGVQGLTRWDADGNRRWRESDGRTLSVAVAPDGRSLLSGGYRGRVRLYDPDGTVRGTEQMSSEEDLCDVPSVAIAPDGAWMAVAVDKEVRILAPDGEVTTVLGPYDEAVSAVAIAPDSSWLALAWDEHVRLWCPDGEQEGTWLETETCVEALAVSPDGRYVAAATRDGVELLDLPAGEVAMFGQDERLTGLAFSPDSTLLATTGDNGCLRIWDLAGRTCESATVVDGELHACAWHPDGSAVYAAGAAGLFGFTYHHCGSPLWVTIEGHR
ncbi:hypothetical protein [Nonomuraea insulae]|uniref:WD40 repeat protein n=1 Tax=Nonomuraea insulae TaxID=1616787 RepID=A0ABW1DAC6_9ACTN